MIEAALFGGQRSLPEVVAESCRVVAFFILHGYGLYPKTSR
jgi:hypothetical protein